MQLVLIDRLSLSTMGSKSAHEESYLRNEQAQSMQRAIYIFNMAFPPVTFMTKHLLLPSLHLYNKCAIYNLETHVLQSKIRKAEYGLVLTAR